MELVPNAEVRDWLLMFWETRHFVHPGDKCPTPLIYRNGVTTQCVLDKMHHDVDRVPVDVPHAAPDGRLAKLLVSRSTILEVRRVDAERAAGLYDS